MKIALEYIAGYITRNDYQTSKYKTHSYFEKYGKYIRLIRVVNISQQS